jgi:HrpA-like RNA helicase
MSNSQKKQQSKANADIKTDKYGVPVNYGNYKNGRLMVKKPSNKGGGGEGGRGGKNQRNGNQDPSKQLKQQQLSNQKQSQKQTSRIKKTEAFVVEKKEKLASVGLTGAAHDVIKDALLVSSTLVASRSTDNLISGGDHQDANANGTEAPQTNTNTRNVKKQGGKSGRHSFPDLVPPPMINNDNGKQNDPMGPMGEQRRGLPVYKFKDSLLDTIAKNRVTVVEGETGSGKTTQVPQFCLEDAAARGVPCNIIIAQPRRISAMSVAERVAVRSDSSPKRRPTQDCSFVRLVSSSSVWKRMRSCKMSRTSLSTKFTNGR